MLNQLLPRQVHNNFQGQKLALWILAAVLLMLAAMSLNSIFNGHYVASNVDGLPLYSYTPAGAQAVVSFYAIWGLAQLVIVAIGVIVLARYRTLVPLMLLLLLLEQLLRHVIHHVLPIATANVSRGGSVFIMALLLLKALGLILSLWRRRAVEA